MTGAQKARLADAGHRAASVPIRHQGISKYTLPDAPNDQTFGLRCAGQEATTVSVSDGLILVFTFLYERSDEGERFVDVGGIVLLAGVHIVDARSPMP